MNWKWWNRYGQGKKLDQLMWANFVSMILGIDIGGTSTKLGLVENGAVICRARIKTTGHADEHAFADAITNEAKKLCDGRKPFTAIGVGAPNGNQHSGAIEMAANLSWKGTVPLARMLEERLGVPCVLGNDANAAALGEWRYGGGRELTDLIVVTLGTGLGGGFIIDGRLLIGPFGNAGELGHIILVPDGRKCGCGRNGCLETYVNISGIRMTYAELGGDPLVLAKPGVKPIAEVAHAGDERAIQAFVRTARWLAIGLSNAIAITAPQRVILFGGIARSGDLLMKPLQKYLGTSMMAVHQGRIDLRISDLHEDDAGILGAAAFATL